MTNEIFWFPKSKIRAMLKEDPHFFQNDMNDVLARQKEFDFQNRKYCGLNFFAGIFINGDAKNARKELASEIKKYWGEYQKTNTAGRDFTRWKKYKGSLVGTNNKEKWLDVLSHMPVLDWFCIRDKEKGTCESIYQNIIHSLLNPFFMVMQAVLFLEKLLYRLLEIGTKKKAPSNLLSLILKAIVCFVFTLFELPLTVLMKVADLVIYQSLYQPLEFFILSCVQGLRECGRVDLHWEEKGFKVAFPKVLLEVQTQSDEEEESDRARLLKPIPSAAVEVESTDQEHEEFIDCRIICNYSTSAQRIVFFSVPHSVVDSKISPLLVNNFKSYEDPIELDNKILKEPCRVSCC